MSQVDLVIKNGRVVTPIGVIEGGVAVDNGKIVAIATDPNLPRGDRIINAKENFVIPGVVDPESHLGSAREFKDDVKSESAAAAAAGVTTWGFMNTSLAIRKPKKQVTDPDEVPSLNEIYPIVKELGEKYSTTDFFYTPILQTEKQSSEIPEYASRYGGTSYKLYLHMKNPNYSRFWHAKWLGFFGFDDRMIFLTMENIAKIGSPGLLCLHPENWEIASLYEERLMKQGKMDVVAWDERSPHFCEAHHIRSYAYLAKAVNCPLYIIHTTTKESIEEVRKARAEGVKITAQAGHHYFTIPREKGWRINVPLRDKDTIEVLWDALAAGDLDSIGSDHVAHGPREKLESKDGWTVKGGFSSRIEALLPVMLTEGVNKGRISIQRLTEVVSTNAAKAFGLYPKKGVISVGSDADLVVVDLKKEVKVSSENLHTWTGWSIYEGWKMKGWPMMTILRGQAVAEWDEGKKKNVILAKPGIGKYLTRKINRKPNH
ncbi:MAG: amidohydrolase family protein [Thaumarchaeota archaeon]|nr:amidohydrolase family protein [Nitrososphaerota archaeon]